MANEFKIKKGLVINGSGSALLDIQGSQGQLFSITDSLSGSLFSVADISGIPVLEAFSDDKVVMGSYGSDTLVVTGSMVGIGTASPSQKLQVVGDIKATNKIFVEDSSNSRLEFASSISNQARISAHKSNLGTTLPLLIQAEGIKFGTVGGGEKMRMDSSGRFLINATSTAFSDKLYINADAYTTGGWRVGTAGTFVGKLINDGGKLSLMSDSNRDIQLGSNNSPSILLIDTSAGNVGIGTTSPDRKLEVRNASGVGEMAISGTTGARLYFRPTDSYSAGGNFGILVTGGTSSPYLSTMTFTGYSNQLNTLMTLKGDGKVGIGVSSPTVRLHVATDVTGYAGTLATSITSGSLLLKTHATDSTVTSFGAISGGAGYIQRSNGAGTTSYNVALNPFGGNVTIGTGTSTTVGGTAKLTVNVGSGTAAPVTIANGSTDAVYIRRYDSSGKYQLQTTLGGANTGVLSLQTYGGNVGIGTTTAAHKLTINAANDTTALGIDFPSANFDFSANSTSGYTTSFHMDNTGTYIGSNSAGRALIFQTNSTDRVNINGNTGNVGIGTTAGEKLSVNGNVEIKVAAASAQGLIFNENGTQTMGIKYQGGQSGNPIDIFRYQDNTTKVRFFENGNVSIGGTSASAKLDVEGNIHANTDIQLRNSSNSSSLVKLLSNNAGEGTILVNNGSNWGFIGRGEGNDPKIGAYYLGKLHLRGFGNSNGETNSNDRTLATFDFGNEIVKFDGNLNVGLADSTEHQIRVFHSDNSSLDLYGYGLYMGRTDSYIRPTTDKNKNLWIGKDSKTWNEVAIETEDFKVTEDGTTRLHIATGGNTSINSQLTVPSIVITDTTGTRGITRNNTGYDLRLSGGSTFDNGASISFSGETRGGAGTAYNGRIEMYAGGTGLTNQAAVTGDIIFGSKWNGGSSNILRLDSATNEAFFAGHIETTRINTPTDTSLKLYPDGSGHLYLGDAGNGMNMYHYSQQNNGKYTTFTHNGTYYRISPTATSGLEITSNTRVSGDLVVTGKVTAEEFHTEYVSASIVYQSGSSKFGDTLDDLHNFTGSVIISGSTDLTLVGATGNTTLHTTAGGDFTIDAADDIRLDAGGGDVVLRTGGTEFGRISSFTNALRLSSSGTNQGIFIVPDGTGNVGIGTSTPHSGTRMQIIGNDTSPTFNSTAISDTSLVISNSDDDYGMVFGVTSDGKGYIQQRRTAQATYYDLNLQTYGGNVAIGTTTAYNKFQVEGDARIRGNTMLGTSGASNVPSTILHLKASGTDARLRIEDSDNNNLAFDLRVDEGNGFYITETIGGDSGDDDRLFVQQSTGNIGINQGSPTEKLDVGGNIVAHSFSTVDSSNVKVMYPKGAAFNGGVSSYTGRLVVTLPVTWTNTMMRFTIKIYDYSGGESFDVHVGGYNYTGTSWINTTAYTTSQSNIDRNFSVKFGHDGSNCVVAIGETTSTWTYVKVNVVDFIGAHSAATTANWSDGWDIDIVSSDTGYTYSATVANTQSTNWQRNSQKLYFGSGTGEVGIGLTAPASKLHIRGADSTSNVSDNAIFTYENQQQEGVSFGYDTDGNYAWLYSREVGVSSRALRLNGSLFVNNYDGNVGISTTSPQSILHVAGTQSYGSLRLTPTSANGESAMAFFLDTAGTQTSNAWIIGHAGWGNTGDFVIGNQQFGGPIMLIQQDGKVGIGTTTPQKVLDVYLGTDTAVASIGGLISSGEYAGLHFGYSEAGNSNYRHSAIVFERDDASHGDARGKIHILNSAAGSASADLGDSRLTILPSGNVGIGTTSPTKVLHVVGDVLLSGNTSFKPKHYVNTDDPNSSSRTIFSTHQTNGSTSNRPVNWSTIYTLGGSGANALQISTNPDYEESGMWIRQYNGNNASPQGTGWQNWAEVWTTNHAPLTKITNWDTAYTYSQVGHLPLTAGSGKSLTGTLYIDSSSTTGNQAITFERSGQETYKITHGTSGLYFNHPNATSLLLGLTQGGDVTIHNSSSEVYVRFDQSSKYVGIGETAPEAKLHVVDDTDFTSGQTSVEVLKLQRKNTGGDIKATTEGHISMWATDSNNDTEWGRISWVNDNTGDGGLETEGAMSFWTSKEGTLTRAMYINHDQEIGIGTTTPDASLKIVDDSNSSTTSLSLNDRIKFRGDGVMSWGSTAQYGQLNWSGNYALVTGLTGKGLKFNVGGSSLALTLDTNLDATFAGDILMPTAGQQLRIGSFTDGANNSGEYANDDLVIGDGSISIYPHRRGDYGLNESTATSTTFRSKLNIWSDNEDHITFGGASTHMVSAWETWKIWINNDSTSNGIFKLYHTSAKTEFARFSGDGTTSFITGKFNATKELAVSSVAATNGSPATDNISVSGYGMIGNRGAVYLTNSNTNAQASVQIGVGGVHAAATKLQINPSNSIFSTNISAGADSTYDIGTSATRFANVYADNYYGDGSNLTNITVTETDTLDSVSDRGATTDKALTIGASATNGGRVLSQNYSGTNRLGVISSHASSGNFLIGYGAEGKVGSSGNFVSTYSNFSGGHAALSISGTHLRWYAESSNSTTAIGSDLTLAEVFSVNRDGDTDIAGALTLGTALAVAEGGTGVTSNTSWLNSNAFANFASTSGDYDNFTRGLQRGQGGSNGPDGTSHTTGFTILQSDTNYGFQLFSNNSNNNDEGLYYRYKGTSYQPWQTIVTKTYGDGRYVRPSTAPNAPTNLVTSIVNDTINVTFTASTTSDIDNYVVFSSVAGGDYGLISVIPPADFGSTMSVIDDSFNAGGTQAYRVYAVKNGVYSSPLTGTKSFTVGTVEPTNMSVVNLNTAYYIQYDAPSTKTRFVTAYNIYKHEHASQSSLSRSSATLIYSGMNNSYMYQISGNNNSNFHKFWVETTVA